MISLFKKNKQIAAPVKGECIGIEEVNDKVFSSKMMGDGFAIIPQEDVVASPIKGEVVMLASTKHAFGIKSKDGLEVLIHIGIDSVNLNGEGFEVLVKEGEKVNVGDSIIKCDFNLMRCHNIDTTTIVVITAGYEHEVNIKAVHDIVEKGQILVQ